MLYLLFVISVKIIALTFGVVNFRNLTIPYRVIFSQVLLALFCEVLGYYLSFGAKHNIWLYNLYWLVGELWLMTVPGIILLRRAVLRRFLFFITIITTLIWIVKIYQHGLSKFSPFILLSIYLTTLLIYFIVLFHIALSTEEKLVKLPAFWLCLSVIIYFGCNIPYYGLYNYLESKEPKLLNQLFDITLVLNFIRYPLVAVSFYLMGRQHKIVKQKSSA